MKRFLATIPLLLLGLASCGAPSTPFSLLPDSSNEAPISHSPSIPEKSSPAPAISSSEPPKTSSTQIEVSSEQPIGSLSSEEAVPSDPVASSEQPSVSSEDPIVISEEPIQSSEPEVHLDPHEIYGGYYASLSTWDDGDDLKAKLHEIIHGGTYQPLTYAGSVTNWVSNSEADEYLYDHEFVDPVYSDLPMLKTSTGKWQREHAWCASLMTGSATGNAVKELGRATDFHNLFASTENGNTSRGNKNYGIANPSAPSFTDRRTSDKKDGYCYDSVTFEPADHDKGRLSRAIFYMATMYCEDEYDSKNNIMMGGLQIVEEDVPYVSGEDCAFAIGHLSELLSWSEFPVDLNEYQHNESVYGYIPNVHNDPTHNVAQGNRNPYVDFPGLVDYVFGDKKEQAGSLSDLLSSYESLGINQQGVHHYAIDTAKRQYDDDDIFHLSDISLVAVDHNLNETPFTGFTVEGATDGEEFAFGGNQTLTIKTPINDIEYNVLVETDPIQSATWNHKVTAKSTGNDFAGIAAENGVTHTLNFDGVNWDVTFQSGSVQSNSAALGCKFGTASAPVTKLTFETTSAFSYSGKSTVTGVYLSGATAANCTYNVAMSVGDVTVGSFMMTYVDNKTTVTVGQMLETPATGKVKIEITNITNAVYVQYLAVHAI